MSQVRRFAAASLEEAARRNGRRGGMVIGALDETGQEKAGAATAGVKRQYMGCAGRVANGINTVHLSYVRAGTGHALAGARQWIPREHIEDPVTSLVMRLPPGLEFAAGVPWAGWSGWWLVAAGFAVCPFSGLVSLRRCVGSRNRALAALAAGGQRSFSEGEKHLGRPAARRAGSLLRGAVT